MKANKIMTLFALSTALMGCGSNSSSDFDFNANDIKYDIDPKTGICYSAVAVQQDASWDSKDLKVTCIPCTEEVLKNVNQKNLNTAKAANITPLKTFVIQ